MNKKLRYSILVTDLLWIAAVFEAMHIGQNRQILGGGLREGLYATAVLLGLSTWAILYFKERLHGFEGGRWFPTVFAQVTTGVIYLLGALLIFALVSKNGELRSELLYIGILLPSGFISIRSLAWWLVLSGHSGVARRRVVILGGGQLVHDVARKISRHVEFPMEVAGVMFPSETDPSNRLIGLPAGTVFLRTFGILGLLKEKKAQELIVVEPLPPGLESERLISNCRKAGIRVHLVPLRYELCLSKAKLTEIEDVSLLSLEEQTLSIVRLRLKRIVDFLGALFLLVVSAPLLALSAVALRSRKDRALRKDLRCGKDGRQFWMYRLNVDRWAPDLAGCACIFARFSVTELPQLWNVLKGDMSLVGPRPEPPERVQHYSMWQRQRLSVMPGMTGLAQVNGLRENHSSEEKAHFDLQYIFHWSLFRDLSLLLQTICTLFARVTERDIPAAAYEGSPAGKPMFRIPKVLNADRTQSSAY